MPEMKKIPVDKIRIPDVRVSSILDEEQKAILKSTIKEVGVIQDPVVRPLPDGAFEVVAGKSRILELASQGATEITVKVIETDERTALTMNIIENVARGTFDYISVAQSIRKLKTLGATDQDLVKIFPWRPQWLNFIEELQDLPEDITQAIKDKKITPSHVQIAVALPTPYEIHDGLKTAINMGWDSGTLRTYVQNRVSQIEAAKAEAQARGVEPEIPPPNPTQLIQYRQCLLCGYRYPTEAVTLQHACTDCQDLVKYIVDLLGQPKDAIQKVYVAMSAYFGQRPQVPVSSEPTTKAAGPP